MYGISVCFEVSQPQRTPRQSKVPRRPFFLGLAGGTGAGKSTVAIHLAKTFPNRVVLLSLDDYYRDRSDVPPAEREQINFDHPDAIE